MPILGPLNLKAGRKTLFKSCQQTCNSHQLRVSTRFLFEPGRSTVTRRDRRAKLTTNALSLSGLIVLGKTVSGPSAMDYFNDALPFLSQTQTDYGEDISGLILAFEEPASLSYASTQSASDGPPNSTSPSLESIKKRKHSDPSDTSSSTIDDRPAKRPKQDNDPDHPYIIAASRLVEEYPGLPHGVLFELARLITASKLSIGDISSCQLSKLKGNNVQSAPETIRVLFPDTASDARQDPAFVQEAAATSPWEELDKEEDALSLDPYAGLGHGEHTPGWYGGKIEFRGSLEHDGSYRVKLERCALGPSCRFSRRFGSKNILRIKIKSSLLHSQDNGLQDFFRKPFVLWGSVFRSFYAKDDTVFLFRTNEGMVDGEIVPKQFPGFSLLEFLDWHNPPLPNSNQAMTKWTARFALGLSNSVPGPIPQNIHDIDDILSAEKSDMTDGCGEFSRSMSLAVCRQMGLEECPTGVQFRGRGTKGMVTERADTSPSGPLEIWLRPSQIKIRYPADHHDPLDPTLRIFEILRTSRMRSPARVSSETIINLAENGVPHPIFIHLLRASVAQIVEGLTTWEGPEAMYTLWTNVERAGAVVTSRRAREAGGEARARGFSERSNDEDEDEDEDGIEFDKALGERSSAWWADQTSGQPSSLEETVMVLLDAGFTPNNSAILREKLKQVVKTRIKDRVKNFRYELLHSAIAFVVPDPYGVLGPDEIQVKSSRRNLMDLDGLPTDTILGDVLLTRNPCKVPTDVRKVRAVEDPLLRNYTDVIVCSVQGQRRLLDYLAGGDYDGDTATVIWAPEFVTPFKNADEKYSKEPDGLDSCFTSAGNEKVVDFVERTRSLSLLDQTREAQKYLLGALRDSSLVGAYSTMHDNAIYSLGYGNPRTVKLAYKFCKVLDGSKTGLRIKPATLKADTKDYKKTRGPEWKEWKAKAERKPKERASNEPFTKRGKNSEYITGPFIMDDLRRYAKKESDKILANMEEVFQALDVVRDHHLTQPWDDADKMANRGTPELQAAKRRDLDRIKYHVEDMFREHRSQIQKNFTGKQIETRQDILRNLSKRFVASPTLDHMETFTDAASISRLRASYAYLYDFRQKAKGPGFSRFPWDMALRDLCHIKASALGPSKTVTIGFYERFRLSRR
ncbi:RNA dependent RNA polymerase-domain-containing protein [Lyophyllum atratum]|nr:RNA dependent RNA polymerase-domain-containing protein [Lyophyllum atratum]